MTAEVLNGTLERVVFHDAKTRFVVARLQLSTGELVTIRGSLGGVRVGAPVWLAGAWIDDRRWGRQFVAESYQLTAPAPDNGRAECPDDALAFLRKQGVSLPYATRINNRYGIEAAKVVRTNPYRLAREVWGVGFPVADSIATQLKIARDLPERLDAGLAHALRLAVHDGDLHIPDSDLIRRAAALLDVGAALLPPRLAALEDANLIVRETLGPRGACSALPELHAAETEAAEHLARLCRAPSAPIATDLGGAIAAFEAATSVQLAAQQRLAIEAALRDRCTVITGGAGVGKTTAIKAIVQIARANGMHVRLAAPTGAAAQRLADVTGSDGQTIHRLLKYRPPESAFGKGAGDPLMLDLLVVDEASLIDLPLFSALLAAMPSGSRLVLVGDVDQLPSVGPGYVLGDVIGSGAATVVHLTEVYRQRAASNIVLAAHRIKAGELPEPTAPPPVTNKPPTSDFYFVRRSDDAPEAARELIVDLVAERIPARFGISDAQVLSPMHGGPLGTVALNQALQARLTPSTGNAELAHGDCVFRQGDRVMQLRNDYAREIYNGDVGVVVSIDLGDGALRVDFGSGRVTSYERTDLDQLTHAYAISVHKSQGSEYPAVVLALATEHFVMLHRRLIYTAVTRGKQLVVIVGSQRALAKAIRSETRRRHTYLPERVRLHMQVRAL
jgi:exodeoxyribonuclease V alpha subunit